MYSCPTLGLRNLALFLDLLNDSHANRGYHVANSESSKRRNVLDDVKHHRSERPHLDKSTVSYFEERGLLLNYLTGSRVQFAYQFLEGYTNGSRMGVKYRSVSGSDGGWMVNDDNLADECFCDRWWVVRVTHDLASPNLIPGDASYVEPDVVSAFCFGHSNVVCLDRLAFSDLPGRHEDHLVSVLQDSRLDASNRDGPDSGYRANVLDGNSQWLVKRLWWWNNGVP